jgi:glycogen debranching enzyme
MPGGYPKSVVGTAAASLTVLDGTTFCISDRLGDIHGDAMGFFAEDLRFVSVLRTRINGAPPLPLTCGRPEHFMAAFHLRNPVAGGLPADCVTLVRRRFVVGDALRDLLVLENVSERPVSFVLGLELAADFADIITVKEHDFSLGSRPNAAPFPPVRCCRWKDARNGRLDGGDGSITRVVLSREGDTHERGADFRVELASRERWDLLVDIFPSTSRGRSAPTQEEDRFRDEIASARDSVAAWNLRVPTLRSNWHTLSATFEQSIADLAALRIRSVDGGGSVPAAGAPWFMTVFGRDTLITCLQTMILGPELARGALDTLAALQAEEDEPAIDAEPGKIIHELRHAKAATRWFPRYYGAIDTTPLFLVLLSELWRWTDDWALADRFRRPALAALHWIDAYGDRDGDGFVEYERRTARGLENQSWKDSHDSQRFRNGCLASPPIAPCEVQGYVYDAKRRIAEVAREAWRDASLADRLDEEADELHARFNESFWLPERRCYALSLDREKQPVDSVTSNIGHLLWSGIVPPERVGPVVDHLLGGGLWSGWGVRTMAATERAYNPLSYHNGTVWPHDNSLICAGLARAGRWSEAHRIARAMLDAAQTFSWQLPEVFSGLPRVDTPYPVPYPSAARPQAWAAGTPVLLLTVLLGLHPDRERQALESVAPPNLPAWVGSVRLTGVRAFGRPWDATVQEGRVLVEAA